MAETPYSVDVTKTRRTNWDVLWNSTQLGGLDAVSPNLALLLSPVKIGTLGAMKLDDRLIGLEDGANVVVTIRECTRTRLENLVPWFSGSSSISPVPIVPAINTLLSNTYAKALVLHPHDLALSSVKEDINLWKTVPVSAVGFERDGAKDDLWKVTFLIYPDLTKLPANPYGQVGDTPA